MSNTRPFQICTRCVMDTTDPDIIFDEKGVCNHCKQYDIEASLYLKHGEAGQQALNRLVEEIKAAGRNKPYDCIIGVSGGVDSSYVAYKVLQLGLRPLAVHFDSGWNSELAVKNIENIVKTLGIDLYTHVCDWKEMKDLQLSYFKAGVINADIPMDHAFIVVLHRLAREKGIKYFLSGHNFETEGILPRAWVYHATDGANLKDIQKKNGKVKLQKYPVASFLENLYTRFVFKLKTVRILDYEKYDKTAAMSLIEEKLGWKYYGGKHYESVFTRFYQGYYLPERFGVDKRKAHLSSLICSNQLTRAEALELLKEDAYPDQQLLKQDKEYIPKKLGITVEEFEKILKQPVRSHYDYKTDAFLRNMVVKMGQLVKKIKG